MLTAVLLSAAIATPARVRLGDVRDRRALLDAVLLTFSVGTVICATAATLEVLIVGRARA